MSDSITVQAGVSSLHAVAQSAATKTQKSTQVPLTLIPEGLNLQGAWCSNGYLIKSASPATVLSAPREDSSFILPA